MLATRTTRLRPIQSLTRFRNGPQTYTRRNVSVIHTLSEGFLDLAQALPIPPELPAYSTTIILLTVASRLAITLPFSIWAKKRTVRMEELAVPELKAAQPEVVKQVFAQARADKITGTKEELNKTLNERVRKAMLVKSKDVFRKYRCTTLPTMVVPAVAQIPVFAMSTIVLREACQTPTILDSEAFLTITSLSHPDATMTLPIALGLITLANAESAKWWTSDAARERMEAREKRKAENAKKGVREIDPRNAIQGGLRLLSVGRILIGALMPGAILVNWVTSAAFGLLQTWAFDYWSYRRSQARRHQQIQDTKASTATALADGSTSRPSPAPAAPSPSQTQSGPQTRSRARRRP